MSRTFRDQPPRALRPHLGINRALCSGVAAVVAAAVVGTSLPVVAAEAPLPLTMLRMAAEDAPGAVLGLDSDDAKTGLALTAALRKAFANRGISGGEEISLEEMRLTMGCDNDSAECLAQGGQTLGVRRLVFGYLRSTGKGKLQLDIQILDTNAGTFESQASIELTKKKLSSDNIDTTAAEIVNELMPVVDDTSDLPERPDPIPETEPTEEDEPIADDPPKERGVYFGLEKPTPRWKWVGFGTSLGLTVAAGGAAVGMGVWLTMKNGGFRGKLLDEAAASLEDSNPANDVNPNLPEGINLCEYADRPDYPAPRDPGDPVRNGKIFALCQDAEKVRTAQIVTGVGAAAFGVSTLIFTGLLLIHKRKPTANAMLHHGVHLGLAPSLDGSARGLNVSGGLRF